MQTEIGLSLGQSLLVPSLKKSRENERRMTGRWMTYWISFPPPSKNDRTGWRLGSVMDRSRWMSKHFIHVIVILSYLGNSEVKVAELSKQLLNLSQHRERSRRPMLRKHRLTLSAPWNLPIDQYPERVHCGRILGCETDERTLFRLLLMVASLGNSSSSLM